MGKEKDPLYALEQKEKETRDLLFTVLTENARLIEDNKRLRKELQGRRKGQKLIRAIFAEKQG